MVILDSRADLSLDELVRRHRKRIQETAFEGMSTSIIAVPEVPVRAARVACRAPRSHAASVSGGAALGTATESTRAAPPEPRVRPRGIPPGSSVSSETTLRD